jgi:hypothetical protein
LDAQLLMHPNLWLRATGVLLILLPTLFILASRRASAVKKLLWMLASQLPWGFALLYTWVWQQRYAGVEVAPPTLGGLVLTGAVGWWTYAFPWAVYLWFRATRSWFPGEKRIVGREE